MAIYIKGSLQPLQQWWESDYDPVRGFIYRAEFKGLDALQIQALQNDFIQQGIACRIRVQEGIISVEANDSTQEYTLDSWSMDDEKALIDLWSHPTIVALLAGYANASDIMTDIRNGLDNSIDFFDIPGSNIDSVSDSDLATLAAFYSLYQRGTTEFENDVDGTGYVVKHSTNVSNRWTQNIADTNVGRIYTPAEFLSEVSDSSLWINPLSERLQYKISNIPVPESVSGYMWGFRKSKSTEANAANNRDNIQTNYTLALWSTTLYFPIS